MKINTDQKRFYAILGLPSSGTSIISRFFHSLTNAFCIVEPFHKDGLGAKPILEFDKVGPLQMQGTPTEFLRQLHQKLHHGPYQMGGIKEVDLFRQERATRFERCLDYHDFDCFIFIVRDPKANYNSIRRRKNTFSDVPIGVFVESCIRFHYLQKELRKKGKQVFVISYEAFCNANSQVDYINQIFGEFATIEGAFHLPPVEKPFWVAVEQTAVRNQGMKPPKMEYPLLRWQEVSVINQYCYFK